jgi:hypothetical protein
MKAAESLSQVSRSAGRDWNPGPPEYERGLLNTQPHHLVFCFVTLPLGSHVVLRHCAVTKEKIFSSTFL